MSRKGPYDATFAERRLIHLFYGNEFKIDERGRIWRLAVRYNKGKDLYAIKPRRAEHKTRDNYLEFRYSLDGEKFYVMAHRIVWQYFYGDIPEGMTVNHINNVVDDNRPNNLNLMTMSDQNRHSMEHGNRIHTGEYNSNSKLKAEEVDRIRILYKTGMSQKDIAAMFDIDRSQISRIVRGLAW